MFGITGKDLAIDLGTSNTRVFLREKGLVLDEPSMVAVRHQGRRKLPVAFGAEAKVMLGRTPEGLSVIRPVRNGVIADFEMAGLMLNNFIRQAQKKPKLVKSKLVVGIPSGISEVEKRAIRDSVEGAASVELLDQAMAAAIGSGLPVNQPRASMIADLGGGTTYVAVISMGQIVCSEAIREGGDSMDEAIINYLRRNHQFLVGETTAEMAKKTLGAAIEDYDDNQMELRGRSIADASPASLLISGADIREAINENVISIAATVRHALENTPPELSGDVMSAGLVLTGGGALLRGIERRLQQELDIEVRIADDPLAAVVLGIGEYLNDPKILRRVS